ncbi:PIN domain-like protein, partial [Mycena epipterygia]
LQTFFYQLCRFSEALVIVVFVFDGPGRPKIKRGKPVVHLLDGQFIQNVKTLIVAFGYYHYQVRVLFLHMRRTLKITKAPGEAEAELSRLCEHGHINMIFTEDSDSLVFGGKRVARKLETSMYVVYTAESLESTTGVRMSAGGLFLFALLNGGDYHEGIPGCGAKIAHSLAKKVDEIDYGQQLLAILTTDSHLDGPLLAAWRNEIREELRTNRSGLFNRCYPRVANLDVWDEFPD